MSAPHLPPPACDLKVHRLWQTIRWLILVLVIAVPTSLAMALVTVVWIVPTGIPSSLQGFDLRNTNSRDTSDISPVIYGQVKQRIWNIYDKKQKVNDSFYPSTALIGRAFMVSSDGWAVMYAPKYVSGQEKNWEGLDYQGLTYPISKVLVDNINNVLYLKLTGQGFRVISFADLNNLDNISVAWPIEDVAGQAVALQTVKKVFNSKTYPIWQSNASIKLSPVAAAGSILVNKTGDVIGLADKDGGLVYGNLIERQIGFVLGEGKINYQSLPWKGYSVYGTIMDNGVLNKVEGFYVSDAPTKPSATTVGVGDILIKLQQKPIDINNLVLDIFSAPDTMTATILRGKQVLDVVVKKSNVN